MASQQTAGKPANRLERFRALMARLDAAGNPELALEQGLCIPRPRSVGSQIAGLFELQPTASQLVVGGIGSGKTTELLAAQRRLARSSDICAVYVDVTKEHDIAKMKTGALIVQAGLAIAARGLDQAPTATAASAEDTRSAASAERLRKLARGYWMDPYEAYGGSDDSDFVHRDGILEAPDRIDETVREIQDAIDGILDRFRLRNQHPVVILDGLDRLTDVEIFERLVDQDVKALTASGVGVALVGPLKCLYRGERTITQKFDRFHPQPWIDPRTDEEAHKFLIDVVRNRLGPSELDQEGLGALVGYSGGVLRDLIALARLACEEAYLEGSDVVGLAQVQSAVDAFGRKHMMGLQTDEIEVLQRVRKSGAFVQTSDKDLALLMTRRVLEYSSNGRPRYSVHPTIESLLRALEE